MENISLCGSKTLVISDVHANYPAFKAVVDNAGICDKALFLGDIANFGAFPGECIDLLHSLNSINVIGNHDEQIVSASPKHWWDAWSKKRLNENQLEYISSFKKSVVIDGHILAVHGSYSVPYDILPNTPDIEIKRAFENMLAPEINEVWFGHYHYDIERVVDGVTYRCIRPVGHHRDGDTRASYYIYENGVLSQKRIAYDLDKTVCAIGLLDCFPSEEIRNSFVQLTKNAFHKLLLQKDLQQMSLNEK